MTSMKDIEMPDEKSSNSDVYQPDQLDVDSAGQSVRQVKNYITVLLAEDCITADTAELIINNLDQIRGFLRQVKACPCKRETDD